MRKVALRFYSKVNLGDDLFVRILVRRYKNPFTICLPAKDSFGFEKHVLPLSLTIAKYTVLSLSHKLRIRYLATLRYALKNTDLLVYIGGSIFIDNNNQNTWEREKKFYKNLKVPYYLIGSNFGPSLSASFNNRVCSILQGAKDVCFRDKYSYDQFPTLTNTRYAPDIVFGLDTANFPASSKARIVISVIDAGRKFESSTADKYYELVASYAKQAVADKNVVVLMSFCKREGDEDAIEKTILMLDENTRMNTTKHCYRGDIDKALQEFASCKYVIATRFHAIILGLVFGKKVLPLAYSDKTTHVLNDIGFTGKTVDIRNIESTDVSDFSLNSLTVHDVSNEKKHSEEHFRELDKVLERA
jgi:colanic acid/amylovoran biosynthesis protein